MDDRDAVAAQASGGGAPAKKKPRRDPPNAVLTIAQKQIVMKLIKSETASLMAVIDLLKVLVETMTPEQRTAGSAVATTAFRSFLGHGEIPRN